MKKRNIFYVFLMIIFFILSYLFITDGLDAKVKVNVNYQTQNSSNYKVYYKENNEYNQPYLPMNSTYITSLVDYIDYNIDYKILYDHNINGYYKYYVNSKLILYTDDINNSIWEKEYSILNTKTFVINQNEVSEIKVNDNFKIDYQKYIEEINKFSTKYNVDASGYLKVTINIENTLDFSSIENTILDTKKYEYIIPLTYKTFKIKMIDQNNKIDSYYDFSYKGDVNYLLLILGSLFLAISLSLMALVIKIILDISIKESNYQKELRKILSNHGSDIVNVKNIYNIDNKNIIYVDSFTELLEASLKIGKPINYKEVKKNIKSIFILLDDESAWIYSLEAKNNYK